MSVYVFWSDYDGTYVNKFNNCEQAEKGIEALSMLDYGTTVHGVVEGQQLTIHEEEAVKVAKVKLRRETEDA